VSRKPYRIPRSAAWDLICPTTAPPVLAPAPDLEAVRREAFFAGLDATVDYFMEGQTAPPPYAKRQELHAAWQAQRRGETL
jgi:hypothetical protein